MVSMNDAFGGLANATALDRAGFRVLPARYQDKAPLIEWRKYQSTPTSDMLQMWFRGKQRNYWIMTGQASGCIVIDADSAAGDRWWRERLGDEVMDAAARVKTSKGHHYYFKIPATWTDPVASWSVHPKDGDDFEESFDVRADGTGVIAPPSVHESGHAYIWERPYDDAREAPRDLLDGRLRAAAPRSTASSGRTATDAGGNTRSMLSSLLSNPPGEEGSGRNDWLARVAGHYAKMNRNQRDLYDLHCQTANDSMGTPLDEKEFRKTIDSVWRGEHERHPERELDADCGWIRSGGTVMMTQVVIKGNDDTKTYDVQPYSDFDLRAKGVMLGEDQTRVYWVQIVRKRRGGGGTEVIDAVLNATVTGDDRALRKWFAGFGASVLPPDNMWPKSGSMGTRIQRYLESQQPPEVKVTRTLGWDEEILSHLGGFVTHDGVITADAILTCEQAGVRPDPALLGGGTAPHKYGFEHDAMEAKRVLREVLTFHDEAVTSVFGSWWAACLVKPQIEDRTSLFPFVAIEAPSESGKTNGFFDQMTQLNGNTRGETQPTKAALRDMAAAHRNGIVWVDDLDDPAYLGELLRAATSGGSLTKMAEDRESVKNTKIVAPIVLSGEQLGMNTQKALLDRSITLKVGSPTGRKSKHDPSKPQWDDVLALREQYPDGLADVAGWLVQAALEVQEQVLVALAAGRQGGSGRAADKLAILRAGARLLDYLVANDEADEVSAWAGEGDHARRVEAWIVGDGSTAIASDENTLTLQVLPWALRTFNYPDKPYAGERENDIDKPVFIKNVNLKDMQETLGVGGPEPEIWFSTALLAQAFEREHRQVSQRTQTADALKDQANVLKAMSKRFKIANGNGRLAYYRVIKGDLARRILERAEGK